jgi:hypothetical protein
LVQICSTGTVSLAGLLFSPHVVTFVKKELKAKYDTKFEDEDILEALTEVVCSEIPLEKLKIPKFKSAKKKVKIKSAKAGTDPLQILQNRIDEDVKEVQGISG